MSKPRHPFAAKRSAAKPAADGTFRIIAGQWRRRRLSFPARPGLRPTPDRVRETLFNWLAPILPGARCLDLFAGSGALGLEALSRGAGHCVFVEHDARALKRIGEHLALLGGQDATLWHGDWQAWLARPDAPYDVVFADPPFDSGWLEQLCTLLVSNERLRPGARVYVEFDRAAPPVLPPSLTVLREAHAGQVGYALLVPLDNDESTDAEK